MQTHFKGTNYELTPEMTTYARRKLKSVTKYLGRARESAYAYVDLGKETVAHQNGRIWYADINFSVDGHRFYARAIEESLESAIDRAVNELKSELHTARKRALSLSRKGGHLFKSLMQGFG